MVDDIYCYVIESISERSSRITREIYHNSLLSYSTTSSQKQPKSRIAHAIQIEPNDTAIANNIILWRLDVSIS